MVLVGSVEWRGIVMGMDLPLPAKLNILVQISTIQLGEDHISHGVNKDQDLINNKNTFQCSVCKSRAIII